MSDSFINTIASGFMLLVYVGVVTALYIGIADGYSPSTAKIITAIFVWFTGPVPVPEFFSFLLKLRSTK